MKHTFILIKTLGTYIDQPRWGVGGKNHNVHVRHIHLKEEDAIKDVFSQRKVVPSLPKRIHYRIHDVEIAKNTELTNSCS